jgi:hypothetical protein
MQRLAMASAQKLWEASGDHLKLHKPELAALLIKSRTPGVKGNEKLPELRQIFEAETGKEGSSWQSIVGLFYNPPPAIATAPVAALMPPTASPAALNAPTSLPPPPSALSEGVSTAEITIPAANVTVPAAPLPGGPGASSASATGASDEPPRAEGSRPKRQKR